MPRNCRSFTPSSIKGPDPIRHIEDERDEQKMWDDLPQLHDPHPEKKL